MIWAIICIVLSMVCAGCKKGLRGLVLGVTFGVIGIIFCVFGFAYTAPPNGYEVITVLVEANVGSNGVAEGVEETYHVDREGNYYVAEKDDVKLLFAPFGKQKYKKVDMPVLEVNRLAQRENETTNNEVNIKGE